MEEEAAQRLMGKKGNLANDSKNRGNEVEMDRNGDDSSLSQQELLEDEHGNLYFEDADGNLIPYELPSNEMIEAQMDNSFPDSAGGRM